VKQIRNLVADTEQEYEKEKLNERIARLSGGVAIIQVHSSAETRGGVGGGGQGREAGQGEEGGDGGRAGGRG